MIRRCARKLITRFGVIQRGSWKFWFDRIRYMYTSHLASFVWSRKRRFCPYTQFHHLLNAYQSTFHGPYNHGRLEITWELAVPDYVSNVRFLKITISSGYYVCQTSFICRTFQKELLFLILKCDKVFLNVTALAYLTFLKFWSLTKLIATWPKNLFTTSDNWYFSVYFWV